jgi:GNAT superfamily N-acetyltransferase
MLLIRASDSDLDSVAELANAAYRGDSARAGWTHEADYIDGVRTDAATLRHDLAATPGAVLLMLRDNAEGPLLGCVWLEPHGPETWYLGLLTIRPGLQARQLGRALLADAEAYAAERGAQRMEMTVVSIRDTLIAWYERRGYARTGETRPFPYGDNRFGVPRRDDLAFTVLEKRL